jgi:hypothetical protein
MAKREVRIRMYRQGLGDCFVLTFPRQSKPFHMLVDCGALNSQHYNSADMVRIVSEIRTFTKDRLDVVAATHEHFDHTSGFVQAQGEFDEIDVANVWVAWTENPESEAAKLLKKEFKKGKEAVEAALTRIAAPPGTPLARYKDAIGALLEFSGGLGAAAGNAAAAWQYILRKAPNVYCDPKRPPLELNGVEGVRVYILGPPEDPAYVRRKLSKKETYDEGHPSFAPFAGFVAAAAGAAGDDSQASERTLPFGKRYRITPDTAKQEKFFQERYGFEDDDSAWRRIDDDWLSLTGELALHLDSYTNNTCLALAIELGDAGPVLLFPGDAQVGNWLSWQDLKWTVKGADGEKRDVTATDLLSRTVLYKVGHHGSHNATMRGKGLELMESPDLVAMIPVHRPTARDQDWEFPYPPLWKRLKEKARGRVLLADAPDITEIEGEIAAELSPKELERFKKSTAFEPSYVEYRIAY